MVSQDAVHTDACMNQSDIVRWAQKVGSCVEVYPETFQGVRRRESSLFRSRSVGSRRPQAASVFTLVHPPFRSDPRTWATCGLLLFISRSLQMTIGTEVSLCEAREVENHTQSCVEPVCLAPLSRCFVCLFTSSSSSFFASSFPGGWDLAWRRVTS